MSLLEKSSYRFDDFILDPSRRLLLRADEPVQLTPKVFDTLVILVEERRRPVTYDQLIKRVWHDTSAGKNNLDQNIFLLRRALGDRQRYVRNVAKVGYQLM